MMQFQVFLSLRSVTSCSCKPKEITLITQEIATNASFIMSFIVFVSSRWVTALKYSRPKGHNHSISCFRYSANPNALDNWPIRAHLASQNDELCKKRRMLSERRSIQEQQ